MRRARRTCRSRSASPFAHFTARPLRPSLLCTSGHFSRVFPLLATVALPLCLCDANRFRAADVSLSIQSWGNLAPPPQPTPTQPAQPYPIILHPHLIVDRPSAIGKTHATRGRPAAYWDSFHVPFPSFVPRKGLEEIIWDSVYFSSWLFAFGGCVFLPIVICFVSIYIVVSLGGPLY
jgi:hypothetical protein